jgi:uncharacterized protein (DUF952 family)
MITTASRVRLQGGQHRVGGCRGQNGVVTAAEVVVHLTTARQWTDAQSAGFLRPDSLATEGFVHCSRVDQIAGVANCFYRGVHNLVLLVLPVASCVPELRWESPAHPDGSAAHGGESSDRFPHLYGPIDVAWVTAVRPFVADGDGLFTTPVMS